MLRRCETLAKRGQLEFVVPGKRARMIGHRHASAELTVMQKRSLTGTAYDSCLHTGRWFVAQPNGGQIMPSQLIMPYPKRSELVV